MRDRSEEGRVAGRRSKAAQGGSKKKGSLQDPHPNSTLGRLMRTDPDAAKAVVKDAEVWAAENKAFTAELKAAA